MSGYELLEGSLQALKSFTSVYGLESLGRKRNLNVLAAYRVAGYTLPIPRKTESVFEHRTADRHRAVASKINRGLKLLD